jgi:tetrapyrrole methylase family protein / MazG family protein
MADISKLVEIMAKLRGKDGCPWDREQTHKTLKRFLIEESYEVLDAIDKEDMESVKEELGDVLLQVVFHAQIAEEKKLFNIQDIIDGISNKLIRRHPHVFKDATVENAKDVETLWERIKQKEYKDSKGEKSSVLDGVPSGMPSLYQALRLTEKAARVGFDWQRAEDVIDKIEEELSELKEAIKNRDKDEITHELGDLIFAVANFARHAEIDPEYAHKQTLDRFKSRFKLMEELARQRGFKLQEKDLQELEALWQEAKHILNQA